MARPARDTIDAGVAGWDGPLNDNFIRLFDQPRPIVLHSGDEADLESTYPAASFDKCWIYVDHSVQGWVIYESDGSSWSQKEFGGGGGSGNVLAPLAISVSDEVTTITTGSAKMTFRMPANFTLVSIFASLSTASSSGNVVIDVNKGGASIFTTDLITIEATEESSLDAATQPNITTTSFSQDDEITIDIDSAGTGAKGLKIYMIGTYSDTYPDYSTSEITMGYAWLDGKPVYRKTVACSLPNATTANTAHNASDVETVVEVKGRYKDSSNDWHPIPRAATTDNDNLGVFADATNISLISGGDHSTGSSCYVDIYYTKTTD